jgi:hypothetical protein
MNHVLGAFGLPDFTMLQFFSIGVRFEIHETFISLIFPFFQAAVNRG